jgi:hypothetical protein
VFSGAAKAAGATAARLKFIDDIEDDLHDGHDDELREALHRLQGECRFATVPCRYEDLTLVIGVDEPDEVPEDDSMFVSEAGAREDDRRETRIVEMDGHTGRYELRLTRLERERRFEARAQIESGAAGRCIARELLAQPRVKNPDFYSFQRRASL